MAQPYVGEIRIFAGNFAPAGWMFCEGQLLAISENETLFQLIGTTYGGDGQETFALPDLRGRIPIHQGNGYVLAETGGVEEVTLTVSQITAHNHFAVASSDSGNSSATGTYFAAGQDKLVFSPDTNAIMVTAAPQTVATTGGSQPHNNFMPYLCVDYIISLYGIFPSPT
jgi:microcystin-dependent protein